MDTKIPNRIQQIIKEINNYKWKNSIYTKTYN